MSQFSVKGDKLSKLRCKYMYIISKKNMDVNEHERLSIFTPRHKLKLMSSAFIAK